MKTQTNFKKYTKSLLLSVLVLGLFLMNSTVSRAQTYPPSSVITMPFSNAYYKAGSDIEIHVYSTDIGKSANNGTVTQVEIYNGNTLLGKVTNQKNYTYTYVWKKVPAGTYTLKAKATNGYLPAAPFKSSFTNGLWLPLDKYSTYSSAPADKKANPFIKAWVTI